MTVTRYPFRLEHGQKTSCYKDRWNRVTKKSLTYSSLCLCVFVQVQSIENKLDLLLNLYSQCLKKGSSHFTLSSLLEPDLTSDYHSPTDQRDLFPSANTLNISQSESSNFEWQWAEQSWGCSNTDTNPLPDSTSSLRLSPHFEQPNLNVFSSLHFIPVWDVCLFLFFFNPLHLKSAPSPPFPEVNVVSRADTDRGHQMAPPDEEPQPKLLTAQASQPTTWGWRWREDTWTTMTWLLNHFHPLTSCYISMPTLKRRL